MDKSKSIVYGLLELDDTDYVNSVDEYFQLLYDYCEWIAEEMGYSNLESINESFFSIVTLQLKTKYDFGDIPKVWFVKHNRINLTWHANKSSGKKYDKYKQAFISHREGTPVSWLADDLELRNNTEDGLFGRVVFLGNCINKLVDSFSRIKIQNYEKMTAPTLKEFGFSNITEKQLDEQIRTDAFAQAVTEYKKSNIIITLWVISLVVGTFYLITHYSIELLIGLIIYTLLTYEVRYKKRTEPEYDKIETYYGEILKLKFTNKYKYYTDYFDVKELFEEVCN